MTSVKKQRIYFVIFCLLFVGAAAAIALTVFRDNVVFFFSPTEVVQNKAKEGKKIRLGGLVKEGSITKEGKKISFVVTDMANEVKVKYEGILPDLFREKQGVVIEGVLNKNIFEAKTVLAKHDENYMPPEVAKALKESGHWTTDYENKETQ